MHPFVVLNVIGIFTVGYAVCRAWIACYDAYLSRKSVKGAVLAELCDVKRYLGLFLIGYAQVGMAVLAVHGHKLTPELQNRLIALCVEHGALSLTIGALIGSALFFTIESMKRVRI